MKQLFTFSLIIFFSFPVFSQKIIGIDVFKNIPLIMKTGNLNSGIIIEPQMRIKQKQGPGLFFSAGFTKVAGNEVYVNWDYKEKGYFLKAGVSTKHFLNKSEFPFNKTRLNFGVNFLYSRFKEYGNIVLSGPYFGNKIEPFFKGWSEAVAIEPNVFLIFDLNENFLLEFTVRMDLLSIQDQPGEPPPYYIPGAGVNFLGNIAMDATFVFYYILD